MSPKPRPKERFPLVAILAWPLVVATPLLVIFVRTGDPKIDPMLRLGFGLPALVALLWAFSKIGGVRKYKKHVLTVLVVSGVEFLALFLYFFATISAGPVGPATRPTRPRPSTQQAR